MRRFLGADDLDSAVRGGFSFALGGGGWADHGREAATVKRPEPVSIDASPAEARIAKTAATGASAGAGQWGIRGSGYVCGARGHCPHYP
ncbi:MAG: hypothetical protein JWR80_4866 [Bradyrhizobium sp.]|nr:hypothetical protein [Bradyrhizobium sp.]